MSNKKISLASDNWSPAHPLVLQAIIDANVGYAPPYGSDCYTEEAEKLMAQVFKAEFKTYIIPSGTGTNVFALKLACRRYESVICTDIAHIEFQESGAAESLVGCKLLTVPNVLGKITSDAILKKLRSERAFGKHSTSPRVLSITQPTELGTVYTLEELATLSKLCQDEHLLFHIDGSRLYNAVVSLGISLQEIVKVAKPDLLSLGGTKNGLIGVESLLVFNSSLTAGGDHLQKQSLQLLSKMRYLSAQYIAFFKDDLWRTLAFNANQKAKVIASLIENTPQLKVNYPVESNQIFFSCPHSWIALIQEEVFCYVWEAEKNEIRLICSWDTTDEDVQRLKAVFERLSKDYA